MELIVNLIIVFVVIFSILKRMQDVANKGKELGTPQKVPPKGFSGQAKGTRDIMRSEETESESGEEVAPPTPKKITIEEVFRKFAEQQMPFPPKPEPFYEPEKPAFMETPFFTEEHPPVITEEVPRKKRKPPEKKRARPLFLHFEGTDLVRGILMSEILGSPIALREDAKW